MIITLRIEILWLNTLSKDIFRKTFIQKTLKILPLFMRLQSWKMPHFVRSLAMKRVAEGVAFNPHDFTERI